MAQIKIEGYVGGYSQLTAFIRAWRGQEGKAPHAFVPLSFELGEAFQFDWSEEGLVIGGIYRRMQVSHLKLCASRAFWLVAYPSQGHEMLFDAHTRSFTALGGIPRSGIYDNMKTAVDKVNKGKGRVVNARRCALVPFFLEGVGERIELFQADRIHPTEEAQPMLLANVWPALQPLLK